jgi:hypothetical protein
MYLKVKRIVKKDIPDSDLTEKDITFEDDFINLDLIVGYEGWDETCIVELQNNTKIWVAHEQEDIMVAQTCKDMDLLVFDFEEKEKKKSILYSIQFESRNNKKERLLSTEYLFSHYRAKMSEQLLSDKGLRLGYQANIAMLLNDFYGITDYEERNQAATDILNLIFDLKCSPLK